MNRPRVATVLSAREWESSFAGIARSTSLVRLVARAYEPEDLDRRANDLDVVVAGAETAWVTPTAIYRWRRKGLGVLGLHPPGDRPGRRLLTIGGADEVLPDTTPPERLLHVVRTLRRMDLTNPPETAGLVAVTGSRGAPGISEIALALAWGLAEEGHRTLLIDLDRNGPSLSVRLGLQPSPDVAHAVDEVLYSGTFPSTVNQVGPLALLAGPPASRTGPLTSALINEVLHAASGPFRQIVVDLGVGEPDDPLLYRASSRILTCEATPKGLIRAAATVEHWAAPPPMLVLNRTPGNDQDDAVRAARQWLGLDPKVVIPQLPEVQEASRIAAPPSAELVRLLRPLRDPHRLQLE
jgi:MinD-like ATPase involved in chromosome partitioning or flagellar assembly